MRIKTAQLDFFRARDQHPSQNYFVHTLRLPVWVEDPSSDNYKELKVQILLEGEQLSKAHLDSLHSELHQQLLKHFDIKVREPYPFD